MNGLILLAVGQLGLIVCLIFLVAKLMTLVRSGAPLINFGNSFKFAPKPAPAPPKIRQHDKDDAKPLRMVSFNLPLHRKRTHPAPGAEVSLADTPETAPPRTRSRRLLTMSELESASNRAAAQFPENYYAEIEERLENLFQAYLDKSMTLSDYLDRVREERASTQAVLRNGQVLVDPQLRDEAERAAAAIDWCLDWASAQVPPSDGQLAA